MSWIIIFAEIVYLLVGNKYITFAMRTLTKTAAYEDFVASLPETVLKKLDYVTNILISRGVISAKFVKKLERTDFYELRISVENEYRVLLFAVDNPNIIEARQVLMLNGFLKKSTKDYRAQIQKAENILQSLEQN